MRTSLLGCSAMSMVLGMMLFSGLIALARCIRGEKRRGGEKRRREEEVGRDEMKGGRKRSHREGTESNREGREGGSNRKGRYSERTVSIASHCTFFKVTSSQTCSCCMNPMTSNIISAATILFCLLKRHCSIPCCTQGLNNHNMYMYTSH